jgi:hypothetical protein
MKTQISRRMLLQGVGTAIALPWLEAMQPMAAFAGTAKKPPTRMAFLYIPNGIHMQEWTPSAVGPLTLPSILQPLQSVREHLLVLSGLTLDKARANGDGPGDHARAMASFLTGRQAKKTHGADIRIGISVDQYAAQKIGDKTCFPSLEIGCDRGLNSGNCDSGYSCAYSANISWKSESTPMAKEINPRLVFERLFASQNKNEAADSRAKRERYQLSVLDFVMEDATRLKGRLGGKDQRKLDEYLTAVREIELRLARTDSVNIGTAAKVSRPAGIPTDYQEHIRLMADMLVLAFQADLTRVATFIFANDGSNRSYRFIGVTEGHHDLSHHGGNKDKQAKLKQINRFHISQLAYLLEKMKSVREGESTLLDNSMVVYGGGIGDGNAHNHDNLPILLAGKGNGTLQAGRHIRYPKETPLMNLYLALLDRIGAPAPAFGDSTAKLPLLS